MINVSGGASQGYDQSHRAYAFTFSGTPLAFEIAASNANPIQNVCFEIRNWKSRTANARLQLNGVSQASGPNFSQGINIDADGTFTLIIWVGLSETSPQKFEITKTSIDR